MYIYTFNKYNIICQKKKLVHMVPLQLKKLGSVNGPTY